MSTSEHKQNFAQCKDALSYINSVQVVYRTIFEPYMRMWLNPCAVFALGIATGRTNNVCQWQYVVLYFLLMWTAKNLFALQKLTVAIK